MTSTVYIALGGNLGEVRTNFQSAIQRLTARRQIHLCRCSSLYQTSPVGGPADQPDYLNAVIKIETVINDAHALLSILKEIETDFHRRRDERWAARTLDLDLLLFDELVMHSPELTIPHPLLHLRRFVLEPLSEIAADLIHPVLGLSILELCSAQKNNGEEVIKISGADWHLLPPHPVSNDG